MAEITLRVLDGSDRGKVFDELPTPVTIGREEGNSIQLNDERVSRFHLKIQTDRDKVVLTDLQSTNGTKVNGEDIQLRILRYGDMITVGRSVLLFGSRSQISQRLAEVRGAGAAGAEDGGAAVSQHDGTGGNGSESRPMDMNWAQDEDLQEALHALKSPDLPDGLSPGQAAQLSEIIEYVHVRLRDVMGTARIKGPTERVQLDYEQWQNLLDVQGELAELLRQIGDPREAGE